MLRFALLLPFGSMDEMVKKMTGLDVGAARVAK